MRGVQFLKGRALVAPRIELTIATVCALFLPGCSGPLAAPPAPQKSTAAQIRMPVTAESSTDFGCLPSGSKRAVRRLVKIRNTSNDRVDISRWVPSCECLHVEPSSIVIHPGVSTFVQLVFDSTKESDGFVGDLLMSVEAFQDNKSVCRFDVPVSVVAVKDVEHLRRVND